MASGDRVADITPGRCVDTRDGTRWGESAGCRRAWSATARGPRNGWWSTRRPLTADRLVEARASRDATDQDARHRYQYYLTPTEGSKVAWKEPSLAALARVIKAGTCIEASFQRGKSEVGMDEYQVRTVRRESTIEECGNTIGYTGIR